MTITCTARYGEELAPERRLGLQVLRDGQVVGGRLAHDRRRRTAPTDVAGAVVPERRDVALLDLDPLLGDQPPDLVVSVCRADAGSTTFVWTAYAADPAVPVPDLPSTSTLDDDVAAFATETRRSIQFSADPGKDYLGLAGRARSASRRAIPQGVQDALRAVVEAPGSDHRAGRAAAHRGADDAVGARVPRPRPDERLGRHVAVPRRARRRRALAAERAQAASPPAELGRRPHRRRPHRRLHRGLRLGPPRERRHRGG